MRLLRTTIALTAAALLIAAAGAPRAAALRLLVNGDTPAATYQRWVDAMQVPLPNVDVALYIGDTASDAACRQSVRGCASAQSEARPAIWIMQQPAGAAAALHSRWRAVRARGRAAMSRYADTLRHEVGHILAQFVTAADRAEFQRLTGTAGVAWDAAGDAPQEQFATAVQFCSLTRADRLRRFWRPGLIDLSGAPPDPSIEESRYEGLDYGLELDGPSGRALCRFIRSIVPTA